MRAKMFAGSRNRRFGTINALVWVESAVQIGSAAGAQKFEGAADPDPKQRSTVFILGNYLCALPLLFEARQDQAGHPAKGYLGPSETM